MVTRSDLDALSHAIRHSPHGCVVLSGAGVSVASGVPSFRGRGGLWTRFDPDEYASIRALRDDPERVWAFLRELRTTLDQAAPGPAHHAIAELERAGLVSAVITQNVDGLHQRAGSRRVIELHGSDRTLRCLDGGHQYARADVEHLADAPVPRCPACGSVLKPDVVLFGEHLPEGPYREAEHLMRQCDVLLVVGTSAEVYPAARLPGLARAHDAAVWEINPVAALADTAGAIRGTAEEVLPQLVRRLRPTRTWRHLPRLLRGLRADRWFAD
jgi:NAD-dependent deacetylase